MFELKIRTAKNKNGIIIGMVLGDACIEKTGRLSLGHGEKQREYLDFKADLLQNFFNVKKYERTINLNGKEFIQVGLRTNQTPYLRQLRKVLYKPNKEINLRQLKKLTPLGIALWYMDDGSLLFQRDKEGKIESRKAYLNTQGFSREENEIMVNYFKDEWNINCKIHRDKNYYRLYFNSTELKKLIEIIKPFIINSMNYKICMRYGKNKKNENLCSKECSNKCQFNIL